MSCSNEEIEKKRLAALQKRQSKTGLQNGSPQGSSSFKYNPTQSTSFGLSKKTSNAGPVKSSCSNSNNEKFHPYFKPQISSTISSNVPVGKVVSGTIYLISEERFEVNPSEFCPPLINIFKTIPSRNYDPSSKLWNFSVKDYQELWSKVVPLAPHIVLGPLPSYVLKVLQEETVDPNSIDLSPIEATLRNKLMPFQQEGVRFGIARRGRCMIADDMGLGKTFQALAVASYYRRDWPLLVVTTSSMRETWQSKIHELLPSVPMMNIATLSTGKDTQLVADKQTEVVIVSFKIAAMYTELLKNKKFGVVIIDESHNLKSHKAQCTVALGTIGRRAARVLLLSGTPALSRPAELYTQLALIEPALFHSYTEYGKRYCAGKQTNFGWDMSGQSHSAELQVVLQKRFLIRRTKEQVLTTLEEKTREVVILDSTLLNFTKETSEELSQMASKYKTSKSADRQAALITYFAETARVKIPAICEYVRRIVTPHSAKVLIFAHHRGVVDAVCRTLDEARVHYVCIVGGTPPRARQDLVDKFQTASSCRAAVLSITAAGAGLTLTAARLVVFAELHWNPGILSQAESRAHRLGQTGGVQIRYLLAPSTADGCMWPLLQHKLQVLNDVGLSKDTYEDTTTKHQESRNSITQYLSPTHKNKNDYIPGTNIRKYNDFTTSTASEKENCGQSSVASDKFNNGHCSSDVKMDVCDDMEKSFLEDDENDQLLADLDL